MEMGVRKGEEKNCCGMAKAKGCMGLQKWNMDLNRQ